MLYRCLIIAFTVSLFSITACSDSEIEGIETQTSLGETPPEPPITPTPPPGEGGEEGENTEEIPTCLKSLYYDQLQPIFSQRSCKKANQSQIQQVEAGNLKRDQFLSQCYSATNGSCWCDQLLRPNPASIDTFHCTYGGDQVHQLIHPDEDTWQNAIEAVKIVEEFEQNNVLTEIIYNWWRPEPYNKNVGGSPSRHPFGTSVDVRFKTKDMQNQAFSELCKLRAQGRIRAIGYYTTTAIHFGIGDSNANTWGKACP